MDKAKLTAQTDVEVDDPPDREASTATPVNAPDGTVDHTREPKPALDGGAAEKSE
jgi:hypothetical protein